MELTIKINQSKKEAKALIKYLQSLPFVDIKQNVPNDKPVSKTHASACFGFCKKMEGLLKRREYR